MSEQELKRAAQEQEKMPEQTFGQIGQARAPGPPPPTFTFNATDLGAPELVLEYMKKNFHSLNDATLFQTLGVAIEMRNYRFR